MSQAPTRSLPRLDSSPSITSRTSRQTSENRALLHSDRRKRLKYWSTWRYSQPATQFWLGHEPTASEERMTGLTESLSARHPRAGLYFSDILAATVSDPEDVRKLCLAVASILDCKAMPHSVNSFWTATDEKETIDLFQLALTNTATRATSSSSSEQCEGMYNDPGSRFVLHALKLLHTLPVKSTQDAVEWQKIVDQHADLIWGDLYTAEELKDTWSAATHPADQDGKAGLGMDDESERTGQPKGCAFSEWLDVFPVTDGEKGDDRLAHLESFHPGIQSRWKDIAPQRLQ